MRSPGSCRELHERGVPEPLVPCGEVRALLSGHDTVDIRYSRF